MMFKDTKLFILDMDGTIYLDDTLIEGALEFLATLKALNKDFLFLTNNSSKNRKAYQEKLATMGIHVPEEKIFTSGEATTLYLANKKPGAAIYLLGNHYLEEEFKAAGFTLSNETNIKPDFVVLGFDTTLTYDKIWTACDHLRAGVPFIATHPDLNCPLKNNAYMPDTGAMIKLFEAATNVSPIIIGKPNKQIIETIIAKTNLKHDQLCMVGDRLYTDIKLAKNANIASVLVLSGETTKKDLETANIQPDVICESIKQLIYKL